MGFSRLSKGIGKQSKQLFWLVLLLSLSNGLLMQFRLTEAIDRFVYDNLIRLGSQPNADDIVVIEIDDKSQRQLGRWPWPRGTHAQLLEQLTLANSRIVVFDILFVDRDAQHPESDQRFAQALADHGSVLLPLHIETFGRQGQPLETPPLELFRANALALGHVHVETDDDGIVRSLFLKEGVGTPFWPHISLVLLEILENSSVENVPGARRLAEQDTAPSIGIERDYYNLIPMPSARQGLRHFSYVDVLQGRADLSELDGKLVFIGATSTGLGDTHATAIGNLPGVELNAWIFNALRHDRLIQTGSSSLIGLATALTVLMLLPVLGMLSPRLYLLSTVGMLVGILALSWMLLLSMHYWFPPSGVLLALVAFFPLWSWLRAEQALRFLQREIQLLNARQTTAEKPPDPEAARRYLQRLGLLTSDGRQQSEKGSRAAKSISVRPLDAADTENFWPSILRRQGHETTVLGVLGAEPIVRTIKQLEAIQKRDSEARRLIESSLSQLPDAVAIADLFGQIIFSNRVFKEWLEADSNNSADLLKTLAGVSLKSNLTWTYALSELFQKGEAVFGEGRIAGANIEVYCQGGLVSVNHQYRDTLVLTFTDVSLLKAAENARSEALSFLSHDLRSPMVAVLAILDKCRETGENLTSDSLRAIEALVCKNLDYAESFLQLSKADALTDSSLVPCDMHSILDEAQVHALALASSKGIDVKVQRLDEEAWVLADAGLLERAVNNLVSNAVKYSPPSSILKIELSQTAGLLVLEVADQGPGIAEADQKRLFERFTRFHDKEISGIGLGLAFAATVARKHHGQVSVKSEPGTGSTFSLRLPAYEEGEVL